MRTLPAVFALALPAILALSGCGRQTTADEAITYTTEAPASAQRIYRMDIVPQSTPTRLIRDYQPLVEYLNSRIAIGSRLEIGVPQDFKTFEDGIRSRAADFILGNPWHTTLAIDEGYHVIAMAGTRQDARGILLVRRDSPVQRPGDLRHRSISYPSPTAMADGMLPQWYLHTHGLNVQKETRSAYVGSQESSIMSVYMRQSDASASWPAAWRQFQIDYPIEASSLQVAWETEPLVNNGVAVRDDVPVALREQVQRLLAGLDKAEEGPMLLQAIQAERFSIADDAAYLPVRQFVSRFEKEVRLVEAR